MCVGCSSEKNYDELLLCAIDKSDVVFMQQKNQNKAREGNFGIYWYWHTEKSFGFSPSEIIGLGCADHYDKTDNLRLSWCVHGTCAGSRMGVKTGFTSSSYRKLILVKK